MSDQTRIQRALLINWKGMFFQSFDIDPGMTILEGANGTGKTTIMIAIYTCLIPDLNFLNFQNVTAVSARRNEDKGLYGRIGQDEKNRDEPIFSLLDIVTANGARHLVGVQLIKKTYPQVALKHFAVKDLSPSANVEQLLIRFDAATNQQQIPELAEIGDACKPHGGELILFRHAKDYFQFLFDHEISPIRLIDNEERKKYNQLLHTSLYGGLSRSLQTSLRDYLLPENDKLVQGIHEMEQNLKTCRRTRSAIQRYQSVREVIRQVHETGLKMYSSAFFAARLDAEQSVTKALQVRGEKKALAATLGQCLKTLKETKHRELQEETASQGKDKELDLAKQRLSRCQYAVKLTRECRTKEADYQQQLEIEQTARKTVERLTSHQKALQGEEKKLSQQQMELAKHLSDAGKAWQELSKQVGLFHQAQEMLNEARKLVKHEELAPENVSTLKAQTQKAFEASKETHQQAYFKLNDALLKQEHFTHYLGVLSQITGENEIDPDQAGAIAKTVLKELGELEVRIKKADTLPGKIGRLKERLQNRQRINQALKGVELGAIETSQAFDEHRDALLTELKTLKSRQKEIHAGMDNDISELRAVQENLPSLEKQLVDWERFQHLKQELEDRTAVPVSNAFELAQLQSSIDHQLQQLNLDRYDLISRQKQLQKTFNALINEGSAKAGLKTLAEQGYGTLLTDRYEEIPGDWAANLESRLGPLTNALVVKNIHKAANELIGSFDRPDDVWLVEEALKEKLPEAIELDDSILVKHGDAWRLSRLPQAPLLGKESRSHRIAELSDKIKTVAENLEANDLKIKHVKENQSLLNKLSLLDSFLRSASPLDRIKEQNRRQTELKEALKRQESEKQRVARQIEECEEQEDVLRQFYPLRELLDETDLEEQTHKLEFEWEDTQEQEHRNREKFPLLARLSQGLEILQNPVLAILGDLQTAESNARSAMENQRTALDTLTRLEQSLDYFQYEDQVALLEREKSINSHTESQLQEIENQLGDLKQTIEQAIADVSKANQALHQEEARLNTLRGQLEMLNENLAQSGASGKEDDLEEAEKQVSVLEAEKKAMVSELARSREKRHQLEAESTHLGENLKKSQTSFKQLLAAAQPVMKKWAIFHRLARNDSKYEALMTEYFSSIRQAGKPSEAYWRQVSALRVTLMATLEKIHDARVVLENIKKICEVEKVDDDQAEISLKIWQQIQHYIMQVIPVDLQTADPEKAQQAIGIKLESLEQNLEQQEFSLRIHVQSIPSHLNAEIRKQKSRIRKLNEKLETVRFGFLQTIRIHIETHPKLKRFLDTLPQQLDIFANASDENVSMESLMADLYEKEGAGKVRGDLLMDYRHYVRLSIEVRREGNQTFEKVTSTNLSTGESIGVGIAVLIMVLMSWEEQSTIARDSEKRGSLRFLLLDESSRLDQNALHTLTEFCERLGLQLLIAAPIVERTLRGTTHHLTRGHFDGREEVIVRGRRILPDTGQPAAAT